MATGTLPNPPAPPMQAPPAAPPSQEEAYIERQIGATRTQVRVVEIISAVVTLLAATLGYLLLLVIVDQWVFSLGFWLRMVALAGLVGGVGWFIWDRIVPLIVRQINPIYAAHTIEQAEPSLKNSLINFLLLRKNREEVHGVVYQALGRRAAADLSHVPDDTAIDRSGLIRMGYVLAGVLAVAAAYKILSPKDPFQSVARVVVPWADIEPASRVSIDKIEPGDIEIFQGESVTVTAAVDNLKSKDEVTLVYSTIDGLAIDQRVPMELDSAGLKYTATLGVADPGSGKIGIDQSLIYRIEAGDAVTSDYRVEVLPAPAIWVKEVQYDYPKYTGEASAKSSGGDISAIEGTLVTLHLSANQEIESAFVEFNPAVGDDESTGKSTRMSIKRIDGDAAQARFYIRLADDGRSPWRHSYRVIFDTKDGHRNTRPIVHTIQVKPDLPPIVEILQPEQRRIEVPLNRKAEIEVRAVDPDYALWRVRVVGQREGADLLDAALLESEKGHEGQAIRKYEFQPKTLGLNVGDIVNYWAAAEDNRTAIKGDRRAPNLARTRPAYQIEVIAPERDEDGAPQEQPQDGQPMDGDNQNGQGGGEDQQPQDGNMGEGQPQEGQMGEGNNGGGQEGQPQDGDPEMGMGQNQSGEGSMGDQDNPQQGGQGQQGGQDQQNGDPQAGENATGGEGQPGQQPSDGDQQNMGGEHGNQQGSPQDGANQSGEGGQGNQAQGNQQGQPGQQGGDRQGGGNQQGQPSKQPLANDGSEDADAFERIIDHLREQQENQANQGDQENAGDNQQADRGQGENQPQQGERPNGGQAGEQPQAGQDNPSDGMGQSGSPQQGDQRGQDQAGQQQGENAGANGGQNQGEQAEGGNQQSGGGMNQQGERPQAGENGDIPQQGGGSQEMGDQQASGGEKNQDGSPQQGGNDQKETGGQSSQESGGQPMGGQRQPDDKQQGGGEEGEMQSGGSDGQQNDQSGTGEKNQQSGGGSPMSQNDEQKQGGEKQSGGGQQGGEKQEDQGKSPGNSEKGSGSQGDTGGDRKGGGEQGGGQSSQQQGQDSAGSSTSGQTGDGAAQDPGMGQTGDRAGGDQVADNPTGRSGEQEGQGSTTGEPEDGSPQNESPRDGDTRPNGQSGQGQSGEGGRPQEGEPSDQQSGERSDQAGDGSGQPLGGGKEPEKPFDFTPQEDLEPGSDEANLEYARKATDLVLDYLKNQKHKPDPSLLDDLGWSQDDLQRFADRHQELSKASSTTADEATKRRLDESLRSLGLRPPGGRVRDASGANPTTSGADIGARSKPPKEYAEQFKAFTKSRKNR